MTKLQEYTEREGLLILYQEQDRFIVAHKDDTYYIFMYIWGYLRTLEGVYIPDDKGKDPYCFFKGTEKQLKDVIKEMDQGFANGVLQALFNKELEKEIK